MGLFPFRIDTEAYNSEDGERALRIPEKGINP